MSDESSHTSVNMSSSIDTAEAPKVEAPVSEEKTFMAKLFAFSLTDIQAAVAEFVGMTFFIFLALTIVQGALNQNSTLAAQPLSSATILLIATGFGIALMIGIGMVAHISGGHLNPAVTIGLFSAGHISLPKAVLYIIFQCLGACAGAGLADAVTAGPLLGYNAVNKNITNNAALLAEVFLTFVLVMTVFRTAVDAPKSDKLFAPFYIGFSVFVAHMAGVAIDGTSINPARSFGASAISGEWENQWIFWVGPILGGLLASFVRFALDKNYKQD
jgi:MIP family channel proteins